MNNDRTWGQYITTFRQTGKVSGEDRWVNFEFRPWRILSELVKNLLSEPVTTRQSHGVFSCFLNHYDDPDILDCEYAYMTQIENNTRGAIQKPISLLTWWMHFDRFGVVSPSFRTIVSDQYTLFQAQQLTKRLWTLPVENKPLAAALFTANIKAYLASRIIANMI